MTYKLAMWYWNYIYHHPTNRQFFLDRMGPPITDWQKDYKRAGLRASFIYVGAMAWFIGPALWLSYGIRAVWG